MRCCEVLCLVISIFDVHRTYACQTNVIPPGSTFFDVLKGLLGGDLRDGGPLQDSSLRGQSIQSASDLDCTFDRVCRWHNVPDEIGDYSIVSGTPNLGRLNLATRTAIPPNPPFAAAGSERTRPPSDRIMLVSDPIPCQTGDGELAVRYWTTPQVSMRVCTRPVGSTSRADQLCSQPFLPQGPGPAFVPIQGPINTPFEIILEASNFVYNDGTRQGGFVFLDDIKYNGQVCSNQQTTRPQPRTTPGPEDLLRACSLFNCDFDPNSPCSRDIRTTSDWIPGTGQVGNRVTGVPNDASNSRNGGYVYIEGPSDPAMQVLNFDAIRLQDPAQLEFKYWVASNGTALEACILTNTVICPFQTPFSISRDSRRWKTAVLDLPAGQQVQPIFRAVNIQRNQYAAIDEFRLLDQFGRNTLC